MNWGKVVIRWVEVHQNPAELEGHQHILALFNSYADREAKTCVRAFARGASYQALFQQVDRTSFHVGLAKLFCAEPRGERVVPDASLFEVVGRGSTIGDADVALWLHDGFTLKLSEWLSSLRWYPGSGGGWTEISALELLWQFVFDTGSLPPFWYDGRWRLADETLYRVWVRHLVACEALPVGSVGAGSLAALGAAFAGFSCVGRVPLSPPVVDDLLVLFRHRSGLGALRLPAFW